MCVRQLLQPLPSSTVSSSSPPSSSSADPATSNSQPQLRYFTLSTSPTPTAPSSSSANASDTKQQKKPSGNKASDQLTSHKDQPVSIASLLHPSPAFRFPRRVVPVDEAIRRLESLNLYGRYHKDLRSEDMKTLGGSHSLLPLQLASGRNKRRIRGHYVRCFAWRAECLQSDCTMDQRVRCCSTC